MLYKCGAGASWTCFCRVPGPQFTGVIFNKTMPLLACLRHGLVFFVALLGALFTMAVFYPGYMSPDSVVQLGQARFGIDSNYYPPLMAYVWRATDRVLPGPAGMLVLQSLVFWFSLALIAYIVIPRQSIRVVFVALTGLWPPTFATLGTIWKDVGMQTFLVATVACTLAVLYFRRLWPLWLALFWLFLASGFRHNALVASLPIILWVAWTAAELLPIRYPALAERFGVHKRPRLFIAGVALACLGLIMAPLEFVNTWGIRDARLWSMFMAHDLAGISVRTNRNSLPPYINEDGLTVADLRRMYSPLHANSLFVPSSRVILSVPNPLTDKTLDFRLNNRTARELPIDWLATILKHPAAYLQHRERIAERLLVLPPYRAWFPYISGIDPNPFGIRFEPSRLNTWAMGVFRWVLYRTPFYWAWAYYLGLLICLAATFFHRFPYGGPVRVLAVSAFLYLLSILAFGMSGDFRYNNWGLTCFYLCPLLLCSRTTERKGTQHTCGPSVESAATPQVRR